MNAGWLIPIATAAAFLATWVGVQLVKTAAQRRHWLDHPNERSSHERPTPRGGGAAIVIIVTLFTFIEPAVRRDWVHWLPLFGAAVIVALVSWFDDLHSLPTGVRFLVHIATAVMVVYFDGRFALIDLPPIGPIILGTAGAVIAVIWIAGLTNAYNFMDGIDGIAGVQALVAGIGWLLIGQMAGLSATSTAGAIVAASALGFLIHNWAPASIFMGDVGSTFLGFLLAGITVEAAGHDSRLAAAGGLLVAPFVFDSIFTIIRRVRKGEDVTKAHRSHLYQRLVQAGWPHGRVSLLYGFLDVACVACALALVRGGAAATAVYVAAPAMAVALWVVVVRAESRRVAQASSLRSGAAP